MEKANVLQPLSRPSRVDTVDDTASNFDTESEDFNEKTNLLNDYLSDFYDNIRQTNHVTTIKHYARHVGFRVITGKGHEWVISATKALLPSFSSDLWKSYKRPTSITSLHSTSDPSIASLRQVSAQPVKSNSIECLDGLRGLACFFVFNFHFLYPWTQTATTAYGSPHPIYKTYTTQYIHQLPILCLLHRGRAMVVVFFAISGYVLTRRPLISIHANELDSARKSLTSSVVRRALRLYIPPTVSLFLSMLAAYYGAYLHEKDVYSNKDTSPVPKYVTGRWEEYPPTPYIWADQFWAFWNQYVLWANPFNFGRFFSALDPHTWTIPLEYRSSIILFMVLLGTMGMKTVWRLITAIGCAWYSLNMGRWELTVFIGGMIVCEIDLIRQTFGVADSSNHGMVDDPNLPTHRRSESGGRGFNLRNPVKWGIMQLRHTPALIVLGQLFKCTVFLTALYILSYPDQDSPHAPMGYSTLRLEYTPEIYQTDDSYLFWHTLGSLPLIWAVTNTSWLRHLLQGRTMQYMGKISFSFYLIHGPLLHSFSFRFLPYLWASMGYRGKEHVPYTYNPPDQANTSTPPAGSATDPANQIDITAGNKPFITGLIIAYILSLTLSVWLADIFWRLVDKPCTKVARKVEKIVSR